MAITPFLVHRTSYGFYNDSTIEAKIIADCKRSRGNAMKVYHLVDGDGIIISTKMFNESTEALDSITTTTEMEIKSRIQRDWCAHKYIITMDHKDDYNEDEKKELVEYCFTEHYQNKRLSQKQKDRIAEIKTRKTAPTEDVISRTKLTDK